MDTERWLRLLGLFLVLCLLIVLNLSLGPKEIALWALETEVDQLIFLEIRLPKVLMAISAGGLLGISGLFMQAYFQNPLVGPYILGVPAGASLGVALWYVLAGATLSFGSVLLFSSLGAISILLFLVILSPLLPHKSFLLIFGLILGHLLGGLLNLITIFSPSEVLRGFYLWGMGSFERLGLADAGLVFALSLLLFAMSFALTKSLNTLMLGEAYAKSLGIPLQFVKVVMITLAGLMAALITASCGPIAFVGVLAPHLSRWFWGDLRHQWLITGSFFLGAICCLFVQLLTLFFLPHQIPVNILLGVVMAPLTLVFLWRLKGRAYDY